MDIGKVKWFNATKGFGFIAPQKGPDVFFHVSALESSGIRPDSLKEGQKISYELVTSREGKTSAIKLKLLAN